MHQHGASIVCRRDGMPEQSLGHVSLGVPGVYRVRVLRRGCGGDGVHLPTHHSRGTTGPRLGRRIPVLLQGVALP